MERPDPFIPVPRTQRERPIILRRDRRASNVEEYLAPGSTNASVRNDQLRSRTVVVAVGLGLALIVARIAYLQIAHGSVYRSSAERNRIRLEVVHAPRGIVSDRTMTPLLKNVANFILYATPADLPRDATARRNIVKALIDAYPTLDPAGLTHALDEAPRGSIQPVVLAEHVTYEDALSLTTRIARMPGVSLEAVATRSYLDRQATAHLIGYLGKPNERELRDQPERSTLDQVGRMGVELEYDDVLRGTNGVREVERDHLNKELSVVASRDAVPGSNLVLTIDRDLQQVLSDALSETIDRLHVPGGAAVALDPRNGEILALVSAPSFNPNLFTEGGSTADFDQIFQDERHPLYFRAISGTYPSGSTIKPVIASAALAEGVVTERTTVNSVGGIQVGPNFFPDWKAGGHGITDVRKALAESVNSYFYSIGGGYGDIRGLGVDRMVAYLQRFGLGQKLGIDLPSEAAGFLPTATWRSQPGAPRWYLGDTYHLAIGQGYLDVTPLQVAAYTAAIANGGTLYRPHVLQRVVSPDGTVVRTVDPTPIRSTVDDRFLNVVRSGMRQAVTGGSAAALGDLPVAVAAKTGTAQIGEGDVTHAWLTAFAPYDHPEIVMTVMVERGGEGHLTALPIARRALAAYFNRRRTSP